MNWIFPSPLPHNPPALAITGKPLPPVLARILFRRGIEDAKAAEAFFTPTSAQLHDPFTMKDMDLAVARLLQARRANERVRVYGDYDVDGTTAVALMMRFLHAWGFQVDYYIPDRYTEGYGLSFKGIEAAVDAGASLMITLDCGIRSTDQVKLATLRKLDIIICDHHQPGDSLPAALAVLNPNRLDCTYPNKHLPGCGVGLKLASALHQTLLKEGFQPAKSGLDPVEAYADLAALAIASDLVPVTGENRTIAALGLNKIRTRPLPGIRALMDLSTQSRSWNMADIVFFLGPHINAAGRLRHGEEAVELLLDDSERSESLASALNELNTERKAIDKNTAAEALALIAADPGFDKRYSTVLAAPHWSKGVIGIVASRVQEQHYRPTIVMTQSNGNWVGSARSVEGFDLYAALETCNPYITQWGGHTHAAGLTVHPERLEAFREAFEQAVAARIQPAQRQPLLRIDEWLRFDEINDDLLKHIESMEPFGPGAMRPVFAAAHVQVQEAVWVKEEHLRLTLEQEGHSLPAIWFFADKAWKEHELAGKSLQLAFQPEQHNWKDQRSIQLKIKDIQLSA